jgi:septum formation protein
MLAELSSRTHLVLTAVAVRCPDVAEALLNRSEVRFRATTADERAAYCSTDEPYDKAGGYAIQGRAAMFVEHLAGSYSGVMGLPLFETAALLARCGVVLLPEGRGDPGPASPSRVSSARSVS